MTGTRAFIGRRAERAEIRAALDRAAAGQGGLILLVGEPGIGKTRLADEASDDARARGFEVAWGRCWEGDAPPAFLPWTQVMRGILAPVDGYPAALAPVLPELGPAPPAAGEAAGFELLEAMTSALAAAAARRPHLVVLDDLHAADAGSLRLLEFVVRSLRGTPLLLLASYRDVEARLSPEGARLLGRIAREGRSLPLARLAPDEIAALAEARVGRALPPAMVDYLRNTTEGNPLFVGETVELLAARGELERRPDAAPVIPSGVEDVIRGRLARLSPSARRALQIASVLGREHSGQIGAALIASHGLGDTQAALDEAAALGFLARVSGRHRLSHALVRDAIYESLPPRERRALHLAASRLYEAAPSADDAAFEAAHHGLLALPEGNPARAVSLARHAAEELARRLAFEAAAEMYERALRALPVVPPDPLARCDLLIALARCLISSGAVTAAASRALEAAALARAAGDGPRLAAAALAFGWEIRIAVIDPTLIGLLEEALAAIPPADLSIRPVVMARLAAARQPSQNPEAEAALAREAIALARKGGAADVIRQTLHNALAAMVDYAPPSERLPLATELAAAAVAGRDRAQAMQARMRAFMDHIELGDVAGADADLVALEGLAREVGHPRYRWRPLIARAMRAIMSGRFDEAELLRADAAAVGGQTEDPNFPIVYAMQGFGLALERGDPQALHAAGARLTEVTSGLPGTGAWRPLMTAIGHIRGGSFDEARAAWAQVPAEHPLIVRESLMLMLAGETVAVLGDRALAAKFEAELVHAAGRHITLGQMGMTWIGPVDRVLGLLAATRDAFDEAEAYLRGALAQARAVGGAPAAARIERELAALTLRRGQPRARATPPAAQVLTMVAEGEVWLISYAARIVRLRASRGLAMLARLVAEPGRELHVLDLGAAGSGGGDGGPGAPGIDTGDAGPLLDAQARAAYRDRYQDIQEEIASADAGNDPGRVAKARAELEMLAKELSRGVGLGGRERRAGAAAERARVNVQRRLRDALDRITVADPDIGRHLARSVRTGTTCTYEP